MGNISQDKIKKKWNISDIPDLSDKIVIVTGANSGIGYEATKVLVSKNTTVVMACRNLEKGKIAADSIFEEIPSASVRLMELDLADLSSIRSFVRQFKKEYDKLDILINNAGIMQTPQMKTVDGFELQIGTNHFGHFALTILLIDLLLKVEGSRIVTMSSLAHKQGEIDFDNLMLEKGYSRTKAYCNSKLANLLFAYELQRRLDSVNASTISIAAHPGYSNTNLQSNGPKLGKMRVWYWLYKITNRLVAQSVSMGVLPLLCAATDGKVRGGDYIGPEGRGGIRGYPKKVLSSKRSYDETDAKKLWEISEKLTKTKFPIQ